jgi:serine phosphatase RsbU (regulator of sigma subunit)
MAHLDTISGDQMRLVLDVSRRLAVTTDLDPLLHRIAEAAAGILGCERASIFLHDVKTDELWTKVALKAGGQIRVPGGSGVVGSAFKSNKIVHVPDPYNDPRFNRGPDEAGAFVTRSLLAAPMVDIDGAPLGVIQAINKLSGSFSSDDFSLIQLLADQAGVAIQRYRLQAAAMEIVALRREMDLARKVQEALIPKRPPVSPGLACAGRTICASITGGDCFDLWTTADGRLGIFLGDASGHGLAPTLVVSQARTLVRALSDTETDPHRLLTRVNARLAGDLECGKFVTAFLGFFASDGSLTWTSAGHGPVLIRQRRGAPLETFYPEAPPLAVLEDLPEMDSMQTRIGAGGAVIVVSDGLTEAFNPAGELFGGDRLIKLLDAQADRSPAETIDRAFEEVRKWQGRDDPLDDQTAVMAAPV